MTLIGLFSKGVVATRRAQCDLRHIVSRLRHLGGHSSPAVSRGGPRSVSDDVVCPCRRSSGPSGTRRQWPPAAQRWPKASLDAGRGAARRARRIRWLPPHSYSMTNQRPRESPPHLPGSVVAACGLRVDRGDRDGLFKDPPGTLSFGIGHHPHRLGRRPGRTPGEDSAKMRSVGGTTCNRRSKQAEGRVALTSGGRRSRSGRAWSWSWSWLSP
jgi:hypothetical protein